MLSPSAVGVLERGVRKRPYPYTVRAFSDALRLSEEEIASLIASAPKRGDTASSAEMSSPTPSELPHPATPLVGREREDVAREQGEEERAVALYNEAAAMYRELGNQRGVARALERLAPGQ